MAKKIITSEQDPELERQIIEIVATDRIYRPIASIDGRLKRKREKLAKAIRLEAGQKYKGERVTARVEEDEVQKARGLRKAVDQFAEEYPRYGKILNGLIEEKREGRESHLYFDMNEGCRITADDYLQVMLDLGFTEATSRRLYQELMDVSRKIARKRQEGERSLMISQTFDSRQDDSE